MYRIRSLEAHEWALLRSVRLRALNDAPHAFRSTAEQEAALPEHEWRERATMNALGEASTCRLAVDLDNPADDPRGSPVGMVVGLGEQLTGVPGRALLVSMWVAPRARGSGIATPLVDEVVTWARRRGHVELRAGVNKVNERALPFYTRLGFERLPDRPGDHPEIDLVLPLRH